VNHLTSEQISRWIAGERGSYEQHLRECAQCADAVARLENTLARFGGAYRDWGARQMPAFHRAPASRPGKPLWLRTALASAVLAAIFFAIPAVETIRGNRLRVAQLAAEDDVLLTQIRSDVSRSVPASFKPLAELGASTSSSGGAE
jgi:anti-sigma factor RsiW